MTYQTSPYFRWAFPDEIYAKNPFGIGSLKPTKIPNQAKNMLATGYDAFHASSRKEAHREAMARVRNTQAAKEGMLGHRNTTERSQRYERPASRSAVPNGVFHGSPMMYAANAGLLSGGVITSKEGQEWLRKRLDQRVIEFQDRAANNYSKGPPAELQVTPSTDELDTVLQEIYNSADVSLFNTSFTDNLLKVQNIILRIGATLTPQQITDYSQKIGQLEYSLRGYKGDIGALASAETRLMQRRTVNLARTILERIHNIIKDIAGYAYESLDDRKRRIGTLSGKYLKKSAEEFSPSFLTPEQIETAQQVESAELGRP